ncbi:DUF6191 domain-containing protein [Streptomyces sp. NPDC021098]|uniref:DUF6191 domain-containing protein n=1 Tax=unclassified Streptomyces TaxID=2593676 RepID=UPI0037B693C1
MLMTVGIVTVVLWIALFTWVTWHRRRYGGGGSGAANAEALAEVFHPSRRHVQEQKERRLALRDDPDSGAPPGSTVDLDSGTAVVRPRPRKP